MHAHAALAPRGLAHHVERMTRGGLTAVFASAVGGTGDDAWTSTMRQLDLLTPYFVRGAMVAVRRAADVEQARRRGRPAALLAVEGASFLGRRLERVREAHTRGVRSIQLVHHETNDAADAQRGTARHRGLSAFGLSVVREMNRLRMLVDLADATFEATRQAAAVTAAPFVISHAAVGIAGLPHALARDHARVLRDVNGVLGVYPASADGGGIARYADHLVRAVDALGIDHVGIGTEMDGVPGALVQFDDYAAWPTLRETLLASGFGADETDRVLGGNALRVLQATIH